MLVSWLVQILNPDCSFVDRRISVWLLLLAKRQCEAPHFIKDGTAESHSDGYFSFGHLLPWDSRGGFCVDVMVPPDSLRKKLSCVSLGSKIGEWLWMGRNSLSVDGGIHDIPWNNWMTPDTRSRSSWDWIDTEVTGSIFPTVKIIYPEWVLSIPV